MSAVYIWNRSGMRGGVHADSSNGLYGLSVMAPMSPEAGGAYSIELIDKKTTAVIRHVVVTLPRSEESVALRGGGGSITWDTANTFADIAIDGQDSIRIWVP